LNTLFEIAKVISIVSVNSPRTRKLYSRVINFDVKPTY
jgi:hypothetical protein